MSIHCPYKFVKLTTLDVHIQTFQILSQRHSFTLNGCSGAVPTRSFAFMCTHKRSGHVQYSLKGVHVHSIAFRGCSILTQRHSHTLTSIQGPFSSDTNEIFLMVTPWWVAFNNDSMAFMHTQWVFNTHSLAFMCTQWVFMGCSHSLIGIHAHSMGVHGLFNNPGGVQYVFSLFMYLKAQWICFQICEACRGPINLLLISIECHFFGFAKQDATTSHWLMPFCS